MSEVRLVIRDAQQDIYADRHGSFAEAVVAALSAEPETIEELDTALERFIARRSVPFFHQFASGVDDEPYDAGLVIIDLAARLVICDSTYFSATPEGTVYYHDGKEGTDVPLRFHLSEAWCLSADSFGWRFQAEDRRYCRSLSPPQDVRAVVYGEPLIRFIAEQCFEVFQDQGAAAEPEEDNPDYRREYDLLREIHVQWLMTARDELGGRTPRRAMTARRQFANDSVHDRELQWSYIEQCPAGLNPGSAAYRFAGFGTHELVVYYELVRELLWCCRRDVAEQWSCSRPVGLSREAFLTAETARLRRFRETWLDSPDPELHGRTPRSIIHKERARIPEAMSGHEAAIDPDCPLCQMQAKLPGPVFWHLDGCNMDDDFAFAFYHETYEEWEQEKQEQREFSRRFDKIWAERERLGVEYPRDTYVHPKIAWKMSFSANRFSKAPLDIRLYAIGEPLSKLIVDLGESFSGSSGGETTEGKAHDDLADRLRGAFCRLREHVMAEDPTGDHATILRLLAGLRDALAPVSDVRPELTFQSVDLQNRLSRFLEPPTEMDDEDWFTGDDLPS